MDEKSGSEALQECAVGREPCAPQITCDTPKTCEDLSIESPRKRAERSIDGIIDHFLVAATAERLLVG
jgi:hypothetical protein